MAAQSGNQGRPRRDVSRVRPAMDCKAVRKVGQCWGVETAGQGRSPPIRPGRREVSDQTHNPSVGGSSPPHPTCESASPCAADSRGGRPSTPDEKGEAVTAPLHFQFIRPRGACGKPHVAAHNPPAASQNLTEMGASEMRVLLSTYTAGAWLWPSMRW